MSTTEEKIKELTKRIFGEDADISIKVVTAKMPEDKYKDEKEPNVFVTPSLGGILLKMATEILKDANENGKKVEGEPKDENEDEPKEKETPIEKESNEVYTPVLTIDLADEDERVEFGVKPDTLILMLSDALEDAGTAAGLKALLQVKNRPLETLDLRGMEGTFSFRILRSSL